MFPLGEAEKLHNGYIVNMQHRVTKCCEGGVPNWCGFSKAIFYVFLDLLEGICPFGPGSLFTE